MKSVYMLFSVLWSKGPNVIRFYLTENGSRFVQIDNTGLQRLDTELPVDHVDYDKFNQPQITGVDTI